MRVAMLVRGTVQGVGFRPFVRRAALARGLTGWVQNCRDAVRLEVQGPDDAVASFAHALESELPPPAHIDALERELRPERDELAFRIVESAVGTSPSAALLPPDLATCPACMAETRDPRDRRHRYPFNNCTACGPRYSIATSLPYDRPRTSMASFEMCAECKHEYDALDDRRHHAQPVACPACGPQLVWLDRGGHALARRDAALACAVEMLKSGGIVALRGLGGFQLLASATDARVVAELRARKRRPHKPFAVMFRDEADLARSAELSDRERALLRSPEAPIVLLARKRDAPIVDAVAPGSPHVGAMLPYTPIHALLLERMGPIVCTSGNLSNEPICTSTAEALARLGPIADAFLTHDREVVRPLDDSLVRDSKRGPVVLRRARGYTPRAIGKVDARSTVLALGAHLKSTLTLAHAGSLVPSQHLGDLDSAESRALLARTAEDLCGFVGARPSIVACDLHPDYASTLLAQKLAERWHARLVRVQHHHAHVAACMAEHGLDGEVLGLAWDGTGLGTDGTIWGGEALRVRRDGFTRYAHLRAFPLPGGDRASREPRRAALGALVALAPEHVETFARPWLGDDLPIHLRAIEQRVAAPWCSSVGRVFDAAAAILGTCERQTFEGQAAMELEHLATRGPAERGYPIPLVTGSHGALMGDTRPLLVALIHDVCAGAPREIIARRLHEALVDFGVAVAKRAAIPRVVLTGGCFQNRILAERLEERLAACGFTVYAHAAVPANDGGISVGQAWIAASV